METVLEKTQKRFGLTEAEAEWFLLVHKSHFKAMGSPEKYSLENVKTVKRDWVERTINVYYEDNWWHYTRQGDWY